MPDAGDVLDWLRVPTTWAADMADMPAFAWGVHTRLLLVAARRGLLPADHAALARLAGVTPRELTRCWPAIAVQWVERDGHLTSAYVEQERARMMAERESKREAGRLGASSRWRNHSRPIGGANDSANATAIAKNGYLESETDPELETDPETESDPESRTVAAQRPGGRKEHDPLGHNARSSRQLLQEAEDEQGQRVHDRLRADEVEYRRQRRAQ